jgi:hypothetical protein
LVLTADLDVIRGDLRSAITLCRDDRARHILASGRPINVLQGEDDSGSSNSCADPNLTLPQDSDFTFAHVIAP